jgi:NAD(P)-dependent dehydrogenase (short-subunit alcohol dehydrogenase family)
MRLAGKVALITGAGSGQGEAALRRFVKEGAAVYGADLNEKAVAAVAAEVRAEGGRVESGPVDVSDAQQVAAMVDRAVETFGKLDILYNNAGIFHREDVPVIDLAEAVWDQVIDVNLKSIYLCCKYALPHLLRNGGGSIINTASSAAVVGSTRQHAYVASKAGVVGLSQAIGVAYARHGVRCNAIAPGAILTPMLDQSFPTEEHRLRAAAGYPTKRLGTVEDIVNLAVYLASDESAWLTGVMIPLDGGYTAR